MEKEKKKKKQTEVSCLKNFKPDHSTDPIHSLDP